jgi:hypothetical protein
MNKNIKAIRSQQISTWIKGNSSFITAVVTQFARTWRELGLEEAPQIHGLVVKALWRIGRRPGQALTTDSIKVALERDSIVKAVTRQIDIEAGKEEKNDGTFEGTRHQLVVSVARKAGVASPDETAIKIEGWLALIPNLRNTQRIMALAKLYLEQQGNLRIIAAPVEVPAHRLAALAQRSPSRVVSPNKRITFVVLKQGEGIEWDREHIKIAKAA